MSDVREQLIDVLMSVQYAQAGSSHVLADAILERFDVKPKPVISGEQLGLMIASAYLQTPPHELESALYVYAGCKLIDQLEAAGLTIVPIGKDK